MDAAAQHLLDFSKDFDISLLDQIVAIAFDGLHPQRANANEFLVMLKEHPEMWRRAASILENSSQPLTRFFGLEVLKEAIVTRWQVLPVDQREGIRNYVVARIMALSGDEATMRSERQFLDRLNLVLVQIVKKEWPHNWPTFISDIVGSSKSSETLCENNLKILRLLSEEIFDFSKDSMTSAKIKEMKETLQHEFLAIFELCQLVLAGSQNLVLLDATILTLQRFITWIPFEYIFEFQLIPMLVSKFPVPALRTSSLDCLTEITSLSVSPFPESYRQILLQLLVAFIQQLGPILPLHANLRDLYDRATEDECLFVNRLGLFLSTFLTTHLKLLEGTGITEVNQALVAAHLYLISVSQVDDEEVFKTCLDYWYVFSKDLYTEESQAAIAPSMVGPGAGLMLGGFLPTQRATSARLEMYEAVLHPLRIVMIDKMAKPEEVIVVVDDNGEIVREMTKDTEVIALYKTMRDAMIYLTNLNCEDTEQIMLEKLSDQVENGKFTWVGLNTLCWAIGSISGAMSENDEKRFLVTVIKDLLRLCEEQRGKDNKAVVASNIMYIVGQYPRFLKAHWKFLKTVVNKLFEFMHELHPGVQDMACDTFLKIAQKCKRKFMTLQAEEVSPFVQTLIGDLGKHTKDLQPHQVQSFYESVATMLSDKGPQITIPREQAMLALMSIQNQSWKEFLSQGTSNVAFLFQLDVIQHLSRIIRTNAKVCASVGSLFVHQLSAIFLDLLNIYRLYAEQINLAIVQQGDIAVKMTLCRAMKGVKSDILELLTTFLEQMTDLDRDARVDILQRILPSVMKEILPDYHSSPAPARDSGVLNLFSSATAILGDLLASDLPTILDGIFEPTLSMITQNMLDYPEHRLAFFRFLRVANEHCFEALFNIPPHLQKLVVDSIVWAFKHTERNIAETGLEILYELLQNLGRAPQVSQGFYQMFILSLVQDIIYIMTDRLHKSGFRLQSMILMHICHNVQLGAITVPLFDLSTMPPGTDNAMFLKEYLCNLLSTSFPNVTKGALHSFILGLFDTSLNIDSYKQVVRDFLISCKEFAAEDNTELYIEEIEAQQETLAQQQHQYRQSVPGLLPQSEIDLDPDL